jgi:hypothetical protein
MTHERRSPCFSGRRESPLEPDFSGTGTLACAGFAASTFGAQPCLAAGGQEWLCYLNFSASTSGVGASFCLSLIATSPFDDNYSVNLRSISFLPLCAAFPCRIELCLFYNFARILHQGENGE